MFDRSAEFWVALISAAAYVFVNSKEKAIHYRIIMVASSMGFGYSLAEELSKRIGVSEELAGVIIGVLGYVVIDAVTALIADRELIKSFLRGGKK